MKGETGTRKWMLIGAVAGPFGVRGEMKVNLHTDFPDRYKALTHVYLGPDHAPAEIERSRRHKNGVVLKVKGIDSPEHVTQMRAWDITVPMDQAVALPEGHYYLEDMVGVSVKTTEGICVGSVVDVLRTGSNDVFVVENETQKVLVPAIKDAVTRLDFAERTLLVESWVLEPPE